MGSPFWSRRDGGQWVQFLGPSVTTANRPTAAFTTTVSGLTATFDGTSSTAVTPATISSYRWNFGDGSNGTGSTASHTYTAAGGYTVTLTVTDSTGATNTAQHQVTAASTGGVEPSGPGIVSYSTLTGSTFDARVDSAGTTQEVSLPTGTYTFNDFAINGVDGADLAVDGLLGSGIGYSIIQMVANSSTKSSPTTGTNGFALLRFSNPGVELSGFTLQGTKQSNLYNGIALHACGASVHSNYKVVAIPGNDHVPPGETFGINDFLGNQSTYTDVEVDGAGVGASAFATNSYTGPATYIRCNAHGNPYSAGFALWQHTGGATLTDCKTTNNRTGVNLERTTGTFTLTRHTFSGNTSQDVFFGNDQSSNCLLVIADPVLAAGQQIAIRLPSSEQGNPNLITRSCVKVTVGGVDKTSTLVRWL